MKQGTCIEIAFDDLLEELSAHDAEVEALDELLDSLQLSLW
jgi:hypothetical protein